MFETHAEKNTLTPKSVKADLDHLFDDSHAPAARGPNGATDCSITGCAFIGGTGGVVARVIAGVRETSAVAANIAPELDRDLIDRCGTGVFGAFFRGAGLAVAEAGADLLLQRAVGHSVMGHDLFRPTGLEVLGMGVAAAAPCDMRLKVSIGALSWLGGRVENYFDVGERLAHRH